MTYSQALELATNHYGERWYSQCQISQTANGYRVRPLLPSRFALRRV